MTVCPACSYDFNPNAKKHRSTPQHRRYFGMIRLAYANWPVGHSYQPMDAELCRDYLQLRAGWGNVIQGSDGKIYMIPLSVAYDKMTPAQFSELCDRVSRIIGDIIGMDGDELLAKEERAA